MKQISGIGLLHIIVVVPWSGKSTGRSMLLSTRGWIRESLWHTVRGMVEKQVIQISFQAQASCTTSRWRQRICCTSHNTTQHNVLAHFFEMRSRHAHASQSPTHKRSKSHFTSKPPPIQATGQPNTDLQRLWQSNRRNGFWMGGSPPFEYNSLDFVKFQPGSSTSISAVDIMAAKAFVQGWVGFKVCKQLPLSIASRCPYNKLAEVLQG